MDVAIAFLVGIIIGSAAGIFIFALLAAAKMEDDTHARKTLPTITGPEEKEDSPQMEAKPPRQKRR